MSYRKEFEVLVCLYWMVAGAAQAGAVKSWEESVDIERGEVKSGRMEAYIEAGWLHARRLDAQSELVWHVVLGQAVEGEAPTLRVERAAEVRHANGRYFVRDNIAAKRLSCVRQRPEPGEFAGIDTTVLEGAHFAGAASTNGVGFGLRDKGDWQWALLGATEKHPHLVPTVLVRITPTMLVSQKGGFGARAGHIEYARDEANLTDDGEFFQARYVTREEVEMEMRRRNLQAGTLPPELAAERWVQPPKNKDGYALKSLAMLRGRVVLLDFWATWCTPCVARMPEVQALYDTYAERGFAVVAIHSAVNATQMNSFLEKYGYTMPVMLDTGETARRYGVEGIPQYVLIGRDGRLVSSGLQSQPPRADEIEALLEAGS